MNTDEKQIARVLFQNKILRSDGQTFEDLFTQVMGYAHGEDFTQIKPQGRIGDRKNDGYLRSSGTYFQVFAPENAKARSAAAVLKAKEDFAGLLDYWNAIHPIRNFRFVLNDKYKGSFPTIEADLEEIRKDHDLESSRVFLAKDLEDKLLGLADDQIAMVTGSIPDPQGIGVVDYTVLGAVISVIMETSQEIDVETTLLAPDFEGKLEFNGLGRHAASILRNASYQYGLLDAYFTRNSAFARQHLRDALNQLYNRIREEALTEDGPREGLADRVFFRIVDGILADLPKSDDTKRQQDAVFVVMAYYFESCDVFEDPPEGNETDATS